MRGNARVSASRFAMFAATLMRLVSHAEVPCRSSRRALICRMDRRGARALFAHACQWERSARVVAWRPADAIAPAQWNIGCQRGADGDARGL